MILEISDIIYGKRSNELKKVFGIPGMEQKLGIVTAGYTVLLWTMLTP